MPRVMWLKQAKTTRAALSSQQVLFPSIPCCAGPGGRKFKQNKNITDSSGGSPGPLSCATRCSSREAHAEASLASAGLGPAPLAGSSFLPATSSSSCLLSRCRHPCVCAREALWWPSVHPYFPHASEMLPRCSWPAATSGWDVAAAGGARQRCAAFQGGEQRLLFGIGSGGYPGEAGNDGQVGACQRFV